MFFFQLTHFHFSFFFLLQKHFKRNNVTFQLSPTIITAHVLLTKGVANTKSDKVANLPLSLVAKQLNLYHFLMPS